MSRRGWLVFALVASAAFLVIACVALENVPALQPLVARFVTSSKCPLRVALLGVDEVRVYSAYDPEDQAATRILLFTETDRASIAKLITAIQPDYREGPAPYVLIDFVPSIEFLRHGRPVVRLDLIPDGRLRWRGPLRWRGDPVLTPGSQASIRAWLLSHDEATLW